MDKKKKISGVKSLLIILLIAWAFPALAQSVKGIEFGGKQYEYGVGKDSITLLLKVTDNRGKPCEDVIVSDFKNHFDLVENLKDTISRSKCKVEELAGGQRIPNDFTISVLVDLSIPQSGKKDIYDAVKTLVNNTQDSCVYLSFFGDNVSNSRLVNKDSYEEDFYNRFMEPAQNKYFYSALYAKLAEFNSDDAEHSNLIKAHDYAKEDAIWKRANKALDKNLLFIFTGGNEIPQNEDLNYTQIEEYQENALVIPRVYAFFYDEENHIDEDVERALLAITTPRDFEHNIIPECQGEYMPSDNIRTVVEQFWQTVRSEMYNFKISYQVPSGKSYSGKVDYTALWDNEAIGSAAYSIGSEENPWPNRPETAKDSTKKYLVALLMAFLAILLFIAIMKILVPGVKSKSFALKYYKKYKAVENVRTMICPMCRGEILPGDKVVMRCRHITHVKCWKANDYKCVEYGQNCKEGIQDHVQWGNLFSKETLRDCFLTIMGVCASLIGWVVYEVTNRGFFDGIAKAFVNTFLGSNVLEKGFVVNECIGKVSSFLTIGLLLGFLLSFTFRLFDGVKRRSIAWFLEITGLSLLSSLIGLASFALGGIILCWWMSPTYTFIPWYCSFPAYLLFSVCFTLSLTIRSTIPFKSALLGGLAAAIVGFVVLYFSDKVLSFSDKSIERPWMPMLLNFVIYGGGMGASLITVRMLAEKYFLVIKNGIRNGLRIPIHKWMNAGNKVTIGMTQQCEIQMAWEKSNKVAKEHVQLYVDQSRSQAMMRPMAATTFNLRSELDSNSKPVPLFNGDTFKIGDTIFQYVEN